MEEAKLAEVEGIGQKFSSLTLTTSTADDEKALCDEVSGCSTGIGRILGLVLVGVVFSYTKDVSSCSTGIGRLLGFVFVAVEVAVNDWLS